MRYATFSVMTFMQPRFCFYGLDVLTSPPRSVMTSVAVCLLHVEVIAYFLDEKLHDMVS